MRKCDAKVYIYNCAKSTRLRKCHYILLFAICMYTILHIVNAFLNWKLTAVIEGLWYSKPISVHLNNFCIIPNKL